MKVVLVLVCLVSAASAHVCLLEPHQRGTMDGINTKEASDCGLLVKDCGGRGEKPPHTEIKSGSSYDVIFQKNLNHFAIFENGTTTNGYFEVAFWAHGHQCQILKKVNDGPTPSLHLYSEAVTMPNGPVGVPAILQVKYVTNNPDVPKGGIFYQCSDVELY